jgi:hypothetical protein
MSEKPPDDAPKELLPAILPGFIGWWCEVCQIYDWRPHKHEAAEGQNETPVVN